MREAWYVKLTPKPAASFTRRSNADRNYFCSIMSRNFANNGVESCGPGEASGWYCTQKIGLVL